MPTPTVDRYRCPWRRLVPGDQHAVVIEWVDGSDMSDRTFTLEMVGSFDGVPIDGVTYTVDMLTGTSADGLRTGAAEGVIMFTCELPTDLDRTAAVELQFVQQTPNVETLIAGPVVWAPVAVEVGP